MITLINNNQLSAEQILTVAQTKKQVAQVKKGKQFEEYKYDTNALERRTVTIREEVGPGQYLTEEFGRAPITLAGIDISKASLARVAYTEDSSISQAEAMRRGERKRVQISDYLREYAYPGAEMDIYVHRDPGFQMKKTAAGPIVPAVMVADGENINRELIRQRLAAESDEETALANMAAVSSSQRLFGSFWENLLHNAETPLEVFTPVAPVSKFIGQRTALEDYIRNRVYGREIALWEKPVEHFIKPGLRTTAWWFGAKGLPDDTERRYMLEEYFDKLEFLKQKRLERQAVAMGDGERAAEAALAARRTMFGVHPMHPFETTRAVPKQEREYFRAFAEATTPEERREIQRYVSPEMGRLLESQWLRKQAEGARLRIQAGVSEEEDRRLVEQYREAYREAEEYPEMPPDLPVPGPLWVGYNDAVNMREVKLKTALDQNMDYHQMGFWASDVRKLERKPYIQPIREAFRTAETHHPSDLINDLRRMTHSEGTQGYSSYESTSDGTINLNILSPGYDKITKYLRDPTLEVL
jgi:hypothetical protein